MIKLSDDDVFEIMQRLDSDCVFISDSNKLKIYIGEYCYKLNRVQVITGQDSNKLMVNAICDYIQNIIKVRRDKNDNTRIGNNVDNNIERKNG